jgi:molecular chaperone DnaK
MIHTAEKQLQEHGGQLGAAERNPVEEAVAALREAVSGDDTGRIRQRLEALSQALMRLGEAIQSRGGGAVRSAGAVRWRSRGSGDDVVDAEFEEVDKRRHG